MIQAYNLSSLSLSFVSFDNPEDLPIPFELQAFLIFLVAVPVQHLEDGLPFLDQLLFPVGVATLFPLANLVVPLHARPVLEARLLRHVDAVLLAPVAGVGHVVRLKQEQLVLRLPQGSH